MTDPIPFSSALDEATPDSLQYLFSIDPEHYQRQHLEAIIAAMHKLRERLEAAAASGVQPRQARAHLPEIPVDPSTLGF